MAHLGDCRNVAHRLVNTHPRIRIICLLEKAVLLFNLLHQGKS